MLKIILPGSKKRQEPPKPLHHPNHKKTKMDTTIKTECTKILKSLMTHQFGPVFNQPVDPIELKIPDYFKIITHPMDLGTISKKLDGNIYLFADAFVADVRLTFSNAMRYNPKGNFVHSMAEELNDLFGRNWRTFESKLKSKSKSKTKSKVVQEQVEVKALVSFEEKIRLKRELKRVMKASLEKGKGDNVKTPQTKEVSSRQKLEEISNIESRIRAARAAKEALLKNAKSDLQMKRDRERERVKKMKRTVTMDDNQTVLMELENLCQYSGIKNPLEKIGLRLKEEYYYGYEYMDDDDDGVIFDEVEDGEIF